MRTAILIHRLRTFLAMSTSSYQLMITEKVTAQCMKLHRQVQSTPDQFIDIIKLHCTLKRIIDKLTYHGLKADQIYGEKLSDAPDLLSRTVLICSGTIYSTPIMALLSFSKIVHIHDYAVSDSIQNDLRTSADYLENCYFYYSIWFPYLLGA